MTVDRDLYTHIVNHAVRAVSVTPACREPFPHILVNGILPQDIYIQTLRAWPGAETFSKASARHHSNEYGGSTRSRMNLIEASLLDLPPAQQTWWRTVRAAMSSPRVKNSVFAKLYDGLHRRFGDLADDVTKIDAYPRGVLYSEVEGYSIKPHPDTRQKVVTMQLAFPADSRMKDVGTEFYSRSVNPLDWLREPRGFKIEKTMPFLPNHAYAFSVLNTIGLKSWHGRCKIARIDGVRNSLLQIWYAKPDETHAELESYQRELQHRHAA